MHSGISSWQLFLKTSIEIKRGSNGEVCWRGEKGGEKSADADNFGDSGRSVMQANVHKPAKSEKTPRRKKLAVTEQQSDAMDMFVTPKRQKNDGEIGIHFVRGIDLVDRLLVLLVSACSITHDLRAFVENLSIFLATH